MVSARFTGTALQLRLESDPDDYFNVWIDGQLSLLRGDPATDLYPLAAGLPGGAHTVQLFKRTEMLGAVTFKGLSLEDDGRLLEPPAPSLRRIEFYGDSVTVGQSNEDGTADQWPDHSTHNNDRAYGALAARQLNADYACIAVSGIGLTQGYQPHTMEEIWDRYRPEPGSAPWDFAAWPAGVVVVNLGQNDNSTGFGGDFVERYARFLRQLRAQYPPAEIFAVIGPLSIEPLIGDIARAVQRLKAGGDARVHFHHFSQQTHQHPRADVHQAMAQELVEAIQRVIWAE